MYQLYVRVLFAAAVFFWGVSAYAGPEDVRNAFITSQLKHAVGSTVYKVAATEVLSDDENSPDQSNRAVSNLTPMKVVSADLLDGNAVVLRVELPDHTYRSLRGDTSLYDHAPSYQNFFEKLNINVLDKYPKQLTAKERRSIAEGTVFRGMSEDAFYMSFGYAPNVNDWGLGGEQLIYGDGHTFVYIENHRVVDWQVLN